MPANTQTRLDTLFDDHTLNCQAQSVIVAPDELVHVVGAQEPVREQPDARAQMLLSAGWLKIEGIHVELPDDKRLEQVSTLQKAARAWLKQATPEVPRNERDQVRWLVEKTRPHESKQQIAQRVWLALVLYSLGLRGLAFDDEGQIHWSNGITGRIGLAPDVVIDLAWAQSNHTSYAASFRQFDGTILRGKGRQRWFVYRLTIDPAASPLFARREQPVQEKIALIVASDIHATQPQMPRSFYGGDAFQQACIDAQDQSFDHILVLSPQHHVVSLDDIVPADQPWEQVIERRIWAWQIEAAQQLGARLFGEIPPELADEIGGTWWNWLNPASRYEFTIFGEGFPIRLLLDHLGQTHAHMRGQWPEIVINELRPGYHAGSADDEFDIGFDFDLDDDLADDLDFQAALQDIDQLLEWSTEFVTLVNVHVAPANETWELAPDEALIPVRLLAETGMDIEDLLDLLTDITLLLEQPLSLGLLINASMAVSVLLQITHSLAHHEREPISDILNILPETALRQYIESALQETSHEDQLCACLTLAEQMQLIAIAVPQHVSDQLLVWLQTHISVRMRQRLVGDSDTSLTR